MIALLILTLRAAALSALLWCQRNWRFLAGAVLILAALLFVYRACSKPQKPLTIDEASLSKINSPNAAERQKALEETVYENAEAVKTVDERSTIAESSVIEMQREVDKKVAEADKKIEAVKREKGDVSAAELECILMNVCG
jgi:hypothetical protein